MNIQAFDINKTYRDGDVVEYDNTIYMYFPNDLGKESVGYAPEDNKDWISLPDVLKFVRENYIRL